MVFRNEKLQTNNISLLRIHFVGTEIQMQI